MSEKEHVHEWRATSFTTKAGSTPVQCVGCGEGGFRLSKPTCQRCGDAEISKAGGGVCDWCAEDLESREEMAQNSGHIEEELLF